MREGCLLNGQQVHDTLPVGHQPVEGAHGALSSADKELLPPTVFSLLKPEVIVTTAISGS